MYSDSILIVGAAVKFEHVICIIGSTCGVGMDITIENLRYYPIIRKFHIDINRNGGYTSKNVQVPLAYSVLSEYQRCCIDDYNNICNITFIRSWWWRVFDELSLFVSTFQKKISVVVSETVNEKRSFSQTSKTDITRYVCICWVEYFLLTVKYGYPCFTAIQISLPKYYMNMRNLIQTTKFWLTVCSTVWKNLGISKIMRC